MLELNKIHCGDVMDLMIELENNSIDFSITSPPYWGLRDYGVEGQIGLEEHPNQYIQKMSKLFLHLKHALKKTGSFYLNMGDTYFGAILPERLRAREQFKGIKSNWLQPKQLMLIPSRLAIAMQEDGWILRNDIIWHKPNSMPSSVKDRLNTTFEHLFHFVKSKKYYYDLDSIREAHSDIRDYKRHAPFNYRVRLAQQGRSDDYMINASFKETEVAYRMGIRQDKQYEGKGASQNTIKSFDPKGKNPGDVYGTGKSWHSHKDDLALGQRKDGGAEVRLTHPLGKNPGDTILERGGKGGIETVEGDWLNSICQHCGRTMRRHYGLQSGKTRFIPCDSKGRNPGDFFSINTQPFPEAHFAVYPVALCEKPIKSSCPDEGICLDPFAGVGSTWIALKKYKPKAKFIGFELKKEYIDMAYLRIGKRLETGPLLKY